MSVDFKTKEAVVMLKAGADRAQVEKACLEALAKAGYKTAKVVEEGKPGEKKD